VSDDDPRVPASVMALGGLLGSKHRDATGPTALARIEEKL
jgi:hypothetical protein